MPRCHVATILDVSETMGPLVDKEIVGSLVKPTVGDGSEAPTEGDTADKVQDISSQKEINRRKLEVDPNFGMWTKCKC